MPETPVAAEVVVGAEQSFEADALGEVGERAPVAPGDALLALDHQTRAHVGSLSAMNTQADGHTPRS